MLNIILQGCLEDGQKRSIPIKKDRMGYYDLSSLQRLSPAYNALKGFRIHNDLITQDEIQRAEINMEALLWLNQSIAINKEYAWGYLIRAKIYFELNRIEEALLDIRKVYSYGLYNEFVLYVRALIQYELGNYFISLADLNEAIELTQNGEILGDCQYLKILVLRELGLEYFDGLSTTKPKKVINGQ